MIAMNGSVFAQGSQFSLDDVVRRPRARWGCGGGPLPAGARPEPVFSTPPPTAGGAPRGVLPACFPAPARWERHPHRRLQGQSPRCSRPQHGADEVHSSLSAAPARHPGSGTCPMHGLPEGWAGARGWATLVPPEPVRGTLESFHGWQPLEATTRAERTDRKVLVENRVALTSPFVEPELRKTAAVAPDRRGFRLCTHDGVPGSQWRGWAWSGAIVRVSRVPSRSLDPDAFVTCTLGTSVGTGIQQQARWSPVEGLLIVPWALLSKGQHPQRPPAVQD